MRLMERECKAMDVEIAEFLRSLLRRQQGTSGTTRANQAQAVRPLTTANHPTDPINIYLSEAQLDFLQGFANQCSLSKKALFWV